MKARTRRGAIVLSLSMLAKSWAVAEDIPLKNWSAPAWWSPPRTHGVTTQTETNPLPFIAVTPCRQYDSRNFTPLLQNTSRAVLLIGTPCFLPASAVAVSVNITIFNISGATANGVFQVGTATAPTTSWINFPQTETQRGNAGALPLDSSGQLWVRVQMGGGQLDFTVDVNGYFPLTTTPNPLATGESFAIVGNVGGGVIFGTNSSSAANSYGLKGLASGTGGGSAGVFGLTSATSGLLYGVLGQESSTTADSAGIRGVDGTGSPGGSFVPAGVRGESTGGFGVLGTSRFVGIDGALLNTSGSTIAEGRLGFSSGGTNYGVYSATGDIGATGTKSFVVPDPGDPSRVIRYISLEGPEAGTYFRGRGRLEDRVAVIEVPESFRLVTEEDGLSIQVTPIGGPASLWIQEVGLDRIVVRGPRDLEFFYTVNGVRKGYSAFEPMSQGSEFVPESPSSRLPEGLNPETKRRLIANATYNPDGTVNMDTAEKMGWTKIWASRKASEGE